MLFRTQSAAVYGIDANLVDVEVDLTPVRNEADQPSSVIIVGLPDLAVRESRERIRAAINNSAFFFPFHKTTINLAPADVRKEGASFDLPIALGILGANGDLGDAQYFSMLVRFGAEEEQKRNLIRYNDIKRHRTVQNGDHRNDLEPEYQQLMQLLTDDDSHLARTNGSASDAR